MALGSVLSLSDSSVGGSRWKNNNNFLIRISFLQLSVLSFIIVLGIVTASRSIGFGEQLG